MLATPTNFDAVHVPAAKPDRYARCIAASKRVRWDIDKDVIRNRRFDLTKKFLPDGLSLVNELAFLDEADRRLLSQIQGRTYANMFGLAERFIAAKVLEVSRDHWLGNQTALEALVRFTDEELKHQELFRRIEELTAEGMPAGYQFVPTPNGVANDVLSKCIGTNNPLNVIHATMVALKQLRSREQVAIKRGMTVEALAEGM